MRRDNLPKKFVGAEPFVQMNQSIPVVVLCRPGLGAAFRTGAVLVGVSEAEDTEMEDVEDGDKKTSTERRREIIVVRKNSANTLTFLSFWA